MIEAISVEAIGGGSGFEEPSVAAPDAVPTPRQRTRFFSLGAWQDAAIYLREELKPGARFMGPAILIEPNQTIVVEPGWEARVTAKDHVVLARKEELKRAKAIGTQADPVLLEIFNNLFMSIAEQMGVALQNTAYSVNIKERLDFSCAVFDNEGRWWRMHRICRCISVRWTGRLKASSSTTRSSFRGRLCDQRPL